MKKILLLVAMVPSLVAMDKPGEGPMLIVDNTSSWPVLIQYKIDKEQLERTVPEKSKLNFKDLQLISSLKVVPHGDWLGLANVEKLTSGKMTLPDEVDNIKANLRAKPNDDLLMKISLPQGFTETFKSFIITFRSLKPGEKETGDLISIIPKSRLLEDVFPHVKKLLYPGKFTSLMGGAQTVEARHFLNLPKNASKASIDEAYFAAKQDWEKMLEGGGPRDKAMAEDVLTFFKVVYPMLLLEQEIKSKQDELKEKDKALQKLTNEHLRIFHSY